MTLGQNFRRPAILICLFWSLLPSMAQQDPGQPETVMVTLRAKPGAEAELERVIARHWETAHKMKLVRDAPHVTVRGTEEGNKVYFIDLFTWRDGGIPDA